MSVRCGRPGRRESNRQAPAAEDFAQTEALRRSLDKKIPSRSSRVLCASHCRMMRAALYRNLRRLQRFAQALGRSAQKACCSAAAGVCRDAPDVQARLGDAHDTSMDCLLKSGLGLRRVRSIGLGLARRVGVCVRCGCGVGGGKEALGLFGDRLVLHAGLKLAAGHGLVGQ